MDINDESNDYVNSRDDIKINFEEDEDNSSNIQLSFYDSRIMKNTVKLYIPKDQLEVVLTALKVGK